MEFFKDWQFYFAIIQILGMVGIFAYNWFSHQKIVGNDLHHLSVDVKEIASKQDKQDEKVNKMAEDISYIKGKDQINDKIVKILEKTLEK